MSEAEIEKEKLLAVGPFLNILPCGMLENNKDRELVSEI